LLRQEVPLRFSVPAVGITGVPEAAPTNPSKPMRGNVLMNSRARLLLGAISIALVGMAVYANTTTAIHKKPVKFQFGFEYSVVSQDDFGKRFMIKLNVIPVIQGLVKNPIFGGN
jgi:hypothetical protein